MSKSLAAPMKPDSGNDSAPFLRNNSSMFRSLSLETSVPDFRTFGRAKKCIEAGLMSSREERAIYR